MPVTTTRFLGSVSRAMAVTTTFTRVLDAVRPRAEMVRRFATTPRAPRTAEEATAAIVSSERF